MSGDINSRIAVSQETINGRLARRHSIGGPQVANIQQWQGSLETQYCRFAGGQETVNGRVAWRHSMIAGSHEIVNDRVAKRHSRILGSHETVNGRIAKRRYIAGLQVA